MATYGTIPSTPPSTSPLDFISRAKSRGRSALATRRPWRELFHLHAFSLPPSLGESYLRIRSNSAYFTMNYIIIILLIVFLSLLWFPISLIVFVAMMAAWLFLYFLRDEPIVVMGRTINEVFVIIVLSVLTLVVLLLTGATENVLISLVVGVVVVLVHGVFRKSEEIGEAAGAGGWYGDIGEASSPSQR